MKQVCLKCRILCSKCANFGEVANCTFGRNKTQCRRPKKSTTQPKIRRTRPWPNPDKSKFWRQIVALKSSETSHNHMVDVGLALGIKLC